MHGVQRLMLSKGAKKKKKIWGDITWFPKYFCQKTIYIKFVKKNI